MVQSAEKVTANVTRKAHYRLGEVLWANTATDANFYGDTHLPSLVDAVLEPFSRH